MPTASSFLISNYKPHLIDELTGKSKNRAWSNMMKIYNYNGKKNVSGLKIKGIRQEMNLNQSDLAQKLQKAGISMERDAVSRIELGTRFVADYELMIISKILDVSIDYLLSPDI